MKAINLIKKYSFIIFLTVVLFSCESEPFQTYYPDDLEKLMSLSGFVSNDSIFVCISESDTRYFDPDNNYISKLVTDNKANVTIYEDDEFFCTLTLISIEYWDYHQNYYNQYHYYVGYKPISENKTYKVIAENDAYGIISAETRMNEKPKITSFTKISYNTKGAKTWNGVPDTVFLANGYVLNLEDQKGIKNYYRINYLYENDVIGMPGYENYLNGFTYDDVYNDIFSYTNNYSKYPADVFWADDLFDGETYKIRYSVFSDLSPFVTLHIFSVSEDYYKYHISLIKYKKAEEDRFSKPVQVYSNVSNGLGIFGGYWRIQVKE
jgi:hypothetical protein